MTGVSSKVRYSVTEMAFSSDDVLEALRSLNIAFSADGPACSGLALKSLRNPEPKGIYFATAHIASIPDRVRDSVLLCGSRNLQVHRSNLVVEVANPQLAFYRLEACLLKSPPKRGIHPTAIVSPKASIAPDAYVGPFCVVEDAEIGAGAVLVSHVYVHDNVRIGAESVIESHAAIGVTGVAWCWDEDGRRVIQPQIGSVTIGRNVFLGSGVSIVRASLNDATVIEDGTVIAPGTKIGHGCVVGRDCHLANNVTLGGSVEIGERSFLGSASVVRPGVRLHSATVLGAGAVVTANTSAPGRLLIGVPAREKRLESRELSGVPSPRRQGEK